MTVQLINFNSNWVSSLPERKKVIKELNLLSQSFKVKTHTEIIEIQATLNRTLKECEEVLSLKERVKQTFKFDNLKKIVKIIKCNLLQIKNINKDFKDKISKMRNFIDKQNYTGMFNLIQELPIDFLKELNQTHRVGLAHSFLRNPTWATSTYFPQILSGFANSDYLELVRVNGIEASFFLFELLLYSKKNEAMEAFLQKVALNGDPLIILNSPNFDRLPSTLKAIFVTKSLEKYSRSNNSIPNQFWKTLNKLTKADYDELEKIAKVNPNYLIISLLKYNNKKHISFVFDYIKEKGIDEDKGRTAISYAIKYGFDDADSRALVDLHKNSSPVQIMNLLHIFKFSKPEIVPYLLDMLLRMDDKELIELLKKGLMSDESMSKDLRLAFVKVYLEKSELNPVVIAYIVLNLGSKEYLMLKPHELDKLFDNDILRYFDSKARRNELIIEYLDHYPKPSDAFLSALQRNFKNADYDELVRSIPPKITVAMIRVLVELEKDKPFRTLIRVRDAQELLKIFPKVGYFSNIWKAVPFLEALHENGALMTYEEIEYIRQHPLRDSNVICSLFLRRYSIKREKTESNEEFQVPLPNNRSITVPVAALKAFCDFYISYATPMDYIQSKIRLVELYHKKDLDYLEEFFGFIQTGKYTQIKTVEAAVAIFELGQDFGFNDKVLRTLQLKAVHLAHHFKK